MIARRQNLHATGVERILDVGVQIGVNARHLIRPLCVGVDLVADVIVVETCLKDKRLRLGLDPLGLQRSGDQQLVHLRPRRVIADGHGGVENQTVVARIGAVVHNVRA